MKTNHSSSTKAFTRRELILTLALSITVAGIGYAAVEKTASVDSKARSSAKTARAIYNWLQAYANDNNQIFPVTKAASNDAFRQLIVKRLYDDERAFGITGDAWLKNAPGGKSLPDGNIGYEPTFDQALAPGECSWAYVTGLSNSSPSNLPIMANAFSEKPGIYSKDKNAKGGVFEGKAVWVSVGGSCKVVDTEADLTVTEKKDGKPVNIFSKAWGTLPENVRNPAG
jgi:hypothetical protein